MDSAKENRIIIGRRIRGLREKLRYLQEDFAAKIGAKRTAVSNYESGLSAPQPYMLVRISQVLHTTVDYLVGKTNDSEPYDPESEFFKRIDLGEENLQEYTLILDDRPLSPEEERIAIAFLRTLRQSKKNPV